MTKTKHSSTSYSAHQQPFAAQGRTYLCKKLDLDSKVAVVRPADLKYYTKVRDYTDVHVTGGRAYYPAAVRLQMFCSAWLIPECLVHTRKVRFNAKRTMLLQAIGSSTVKAFVCTDVKSHCRETSMRSQQARELGNFFSYISTLDALLLDTGSIPSNRTKAPIRIKSAAITGSSARACHYSQMRRVRGDHKVDGVCAHLAGLWGGL